MPELRCPECGNELLPSKPEAVGDECICSQCGRKVYVSAETKVKGKCTKCGMTNEIKGAK